MWKERVCVCEERAKERERAGEALPFDEFLVYTYYTNAIYKERRRGKEEVAHPNKTRAMPWPFSQPLTPKDECVCEEGEECVRGVLDGLSLFSNESVEEKGRGGRACSTPPIYVPMCV